MVEIKCAKHDHVVTKPKKISCCTICRQDLNDYYYEVVGKNVVICKLCVKDIVRLFLKDAIGGEKVLKEFLESEEL